MKPSNPFEEEPDESAMDTLLRTYYDEMQDDEQIRPDNQDLTRDAQLCQEDDINSPYFDATMFVQQKLESFPIKELVDYDNDLNGEVKALDSDMQMLVYENYNKFISATDTIRNMKAQVESMEEEMDRLFQNMEDINLSCSAIETTFSPNRKQIEKLVGVRRLLKRLEFLFELPKRLRDSIRIGAHAQAVKYFKISTNILEQYKHIQSFQNIQTESEQIVSGLKNTLRDVIQDPNSTSIHQVETAALLRDLNDPPEHLWHDILVTRKQSLLRLIQQALDYVEPEDREKPSTQEPYFKAELKYRSKHEATVVGADTVKSSNPFDEFSDSPSTVSSDSKSTLVESLNPFDIEPQPEQELVSEVDQEPREKIAVKRTIARLYDFFVLAFEEFADAYYSTFIQPYLHSTEVDEEGRHIHEKSTYALTAFTRDLFSDYFSIVKRTLQEQESVPVLNDEISAFYEGLRKPAILVPGARLRDTAVEHIENIVKHCVDRVFQKAKEIIVEMFTNVDDKVRKWGAAGYFLPPTQESEIDPHKKGVNIPRLVSNTTRSIHEIIEAQIGSLRTFIADETCLIRRLDIPFTGLVQTQVVKLLQDLCKILRRGALAESMAPVHPIEIQESWDEEITTSMHLLIRSQICASMNSSSVPNVLTHFTGLFSLDKQAKRSLERDEKPRVLQACKDSAQILLQGFVEFHGNMMADLLRIDLISKNIIPDSDEKHSYQSYDSQGGYPHQEKRDVIPTGPSGFVLKMLQDINRIDFELQKIFSNPAETFVRPPAKHWGGTRIDRIFAKKVVIFGHVQRNRTSPIVCILKIALKGFTEVLRTFKISKTQFQQIQIDAYAIRCIIPSYIPNTDFVELDSLLDDMISCALDRCQVAEPHLGFNDIEKLCGELLTKM